MPSISLSYKLNAGNLQNAANEIKSKNCSQDMILCKDMQGHIKLIGASDKQILDKASIKDTAKQCKEIGITPNLLKEVTVREFLLGVQNLGALASAAPLSSQAAQETMLNQAINACQANNISYMEANKKDFDQLKSVLPNDLIISWSSDQDTIQVSFPPHNTAPKKYNSLDQFKLELTSDKEHRLQTSQEVANAIEKELSLKVLLKDLPIQKLTNRETHSISVENSANPGEVTIHFLDNLSHGFYMKPITCSASNAVEQVKSQYIEAIVTAFSKNNITVNLLDNSIFNTIVPKEGSISLCVNDVYIKMAFPSTESVEFSDFETVLSYACIYRHK